MGGEERPPEAREGVREARQAEGGQVEAGREGGQEGQEEGQAGRESQRLRVQIQLAGAAQVRRDAEPQEAGDAGRVPEPILFGRQQEEGQRLHGFHAQRDAGKSIFCVNICEETI